MTNKLPCPTCGRQHEWNEYVRAYTAETAFFMALSIDNNLSITLLEYLDLFTPPQQSLSLKRIAKLIKTLDLADKDPAQVKWAIEQMLTQHDKGSLITPLSNHNYLLKTMQSYQPPKQEDNTDSTQPNNNSTISLTPKQISYFAKLLADDPSFGSQYARAGENTNQFAIRISNALKDPKKQQQWLTHLQRVGYQITATE